MSFTAVQHRAWLSEQDCDLDSFRALVERNVDPADYPHAAGVERNVLLYDTERLLGAGQRRDVQEELVRALSDGPRWWSSRARSVITRSSTAPPRCSTH